MSIGFSIGASSTAVANNALGRAQTLSSILMGGLYGAFLGPLAAESTVIAAGVASYGVSHSLTLAYEVFSDPRSTPVQKANSGALLVASLWGANAARDFVKSTPIVPKSAPQQDVGPTIRLYHKGQLANGQVSSTRRLSLGVDKESVSKLDRDGEVFEFAVPLRKLFEWESQGYVQRLSDLDHVTGVRNQEVRVEPPVSGQLNQFKQ